MKFHENVLAFLVAIKKAKTCCSNFQQAAGIDGLNSKTHMKILLKWMTGRKMVKLSCTHIGSAKKFHYSILPEGPRSAEQISSPLPVSESTKPSMQGKRLAKKTTKKEGEALC